MFTKNNIPSGYHISKGAWSVFYILNYGENFVKNLSTNLKDAKVKAKQITGFDVPVSIWGRMPHFTNPNPVRIENWYDQHIIDHRDFLDNKAREFVRNIRKQYVSKLSHVGNIGEIVELDLTICSIFTFETDSYNPRDNNLGIPVITYCHKFIDNNGNHLIYFGNAKALINPAIDSDDYNVKLPQPMKPKYNVGDKITVKANIKKHTFEKNYDDIPLTLIQRPKTITKKGE